MNKFITSLQPYCESFAHSFEPLNAISNIGFIIIALWIFKTKKQIYLKAVGVLSLLLGVGSGLWHGFRGVHSYFADTVPLGLLLIFLVYLLYQKQHKYGAVIGFTLIAITYSILEYVFSIADPGLSEIYLAILLNLLMIIIYRFIKKDIQFKSLLSGGIFFGIAYAVRQIDRIYCSHSIFIHGTHWLWHILCALALYFIIIYLSEEKSKD